MRTAVEVVTSMPRGMVDEEQTGGSVESGEALWLPCAPAITRVYLNPTATSNVYGCLQRIQKKYQLLLSEQGCYVVYQNCA